MTAQAVEDAMDAIYQSLQNDNEDLDLHIGTLKAALKSAGQKQAVVDPSRLAQNNRAGRKMMQSYFKRRGVKIVFQD